MSTTMLPRLARAAAAPLAGAIILATVAAQTPPTRPAADPRADSLIGLWIDSVGGMETYHAFRAASFTVTTVLYDTVTGRMKRSRPRYVWIKKGPYGEETRVERWESYGFVAQGFDGRTTWATTDGVALPDTAKDAREALYVARDLFYWAGLPFKLRDAGVYLTYQGRKELPGRSWRGEPKPPRTSRDGRYHVVGVSFGEGVGEHRDVFTYSFAPNKGFPTEVTYIEEGRTDLNRLVWGRTERAGAIRYPYVVRRDWITASGKRTKALIVSDVAVNPEIPQERFEKP